MTSPLWRHVRALVDLPHRDNLETITNTMAFRRLCQLELVTIERRQRLVLPQRTDNVLWLAGSLVAHLPEHIKTVTHVDGTVGMFDSAAVIGV